MDTGDRASEAEQLARDQALAARHQDRINRIKHGHAWEEHERSKAEDQEALAELDAKIADKQDEIKALREAKKERLKEYRQKRLKGPEDHPLLDAVERSEGKKDQDDFRDEVEGEFRKLGIMADQQPNWGTTEVTTTKRKK